MVDGVSMMNDKGEGHASSRVRFFYMKMFFESVAIEHENPLYS